MASGGGERTYGSEGAESPRTLCSGRKASGAGGRSGRRRREETTEGGGGAREEEAEKVVVVGDGEFQGGPYGHQSNRPIQKVGQMPSPLPFSLSHSFVYHTPIFTFYVSFSIFYHKSNNSKIKVREK